mmetsp:Transcript_21217/g.30331  ORF Transcript_21217/g.30331 Transcript_21217/m.30331 type:complete len:112 (+) Transcript_21217:369-704(+)
MVMIKKQFHVATELLKVVLLNANNYMHATAPTFFNFWFPMTILHRSLLLSKIVGVFAYLLLLQKNSCLESFVKPLGLEIKNLQTAWRTWNKHKSSVTLGQTCCMAFLKASS